MVSSNISSLYVRNFDDIASVSPRHHGTRSKLFSSYSTSAVTVKLRVSFLQVGDAV